VLRSYPALAGQAVAVAAALFAFGFLLADAALRRSSADLVVRLALAVPAVVAWGFVLTVAHIATRGAVFSHPWVVRGVTGAVAAALVADRVLRRRERAVPPAGHAAVVAAVALTGLSLAVWLPPLLRMFPAGSPFADAGWHAGWTQQLMSGAATPGAPIAGDVPNAYPWLYHGVLALLARLTPGGTAFHALGPLQVLQVAGLSLGLFALGREIAGRWVAGVAVTVAASLSAGFGALVSLAPEFVRGTTQVTEPRLVYNATFHSLSPALPRDLALVLLIAVLLLAGTGLRTGGRGWFLAAGAGLGLTGLTAPEPFFLGLAAAALLCLVPAPAGPSRLPRAAALFVPALGLWALWVVPVAFSYLRLGGFVHTTLVRVPSPSAGDVLRSWGTIVPFAVYGAWRWLPRAWREPGAAVPAALLAGSVAALAVAGVIPALLGEGFGVLGRGRRYWPLVELAVAVFAGLGAADLLERAWRIRRGPALAAAAAAALLVLTVPLPWLVSLRLPDVVRPVPAVTDALLDAPGAVVGLVAEAGERPCVVAAPLKLSVPVFSVTGYRLVAYRGIQAASPDNEARIRWADIHETIGSEATRMADNATITGGTASPAVIRGLLERYGVDVVVAEPNAPAPGLAFLGEPERSAEGYPVYRVDDCRG
jgi:hypothetical protein